MFSSPSKAELRGFGDLFSTSQIVFKTFLFFTLGHITYVIVEKAKLFEVQRKILDTQVLSLFSGRYT